MDKKAFSEKEEAEIYKYVSSLAGTEKIAAQKPQIFLNNVRRRMFACGADSFQEYLKIVKSNPQEYREFISSLTIHTTYWFREKRHFRILSDILSNELAGSSIKVTSLGCSTGEEVYSLALTLERQRQLGVINNYQVCGYDVDPVSVAKAKKAIYPANSLSSIPKDFHNGVMVGSGKTAGLMTLSKEIRSRCQFGVKSALNYKPETAQDVIFCRNMLIYFDELQVRLILRSMLSALTERGFMFLGHSEDIGELGKQLQKKDASVFSRKRATTPDDKVLPVENIKQRYDVLVVDDSSVIRRSVTKLLEDNGIKCIAVDDAEQASKAIKDYDISSIVLDLNMPGKNGDEWLVEQRASGNKTPCIILSSMTSDDAPRVFDLIQKYAQDIFNKDEIKESKDILVNRIRSLVKSNRVLEKKPEVPVVIVDDEPDVAELMCEPIKEMGYKVESFQDPKRAFDYIAKNPVLAVITDLKMPEMSGVQFVKNLRDMRIMAPVILVSGFVSSEMKAEERSLFYDVIQKPFEMSVLENKFKRALVSYYQGELSVVPSDAGHVDAILIGSSTGGPQALTEVLRGLGPSTPPVFLVQHIHSKFHLDFSKRVAADAGLELEVVAKPTQAKPGHIYVSEVDHHLTVSQTAQGLFANQSAASPYRGHRPAVNELFASASLTKGVRYCSIILTGMGDDGTEGMAKLVDAGHTFTIAQNMESSVVFGMPREAIDRGLTQYVFNLSQISTVLKRLSSRAGLKAS